MEQKTAKSIFRHMQIDEVRSIKRLSVAKITEHRVLFHRNSCSSNFACYSTTYLPIIFNHVRYIGNFLRLLTSTG